MPGVFPFITLAFDQVLMYGNSFFYTFSEWDFSTEMLCAVRLGIDLLSWLEMTRNVDDTTRSDILH